MAYTYRYDGINWKNGTESQDTPLGASVLNREDAEIVRLNAAMREYTPIIENNTTRINAIETTTDDAIINVDVDEATGVMTFYRASGESIEYDTALEKIPLRYDVDLTKDVIVVYLMDGSSLEIPMSKFISVFDFTTSDESPIYFEVSEDGKVQAFLKRKYLDDMNAAYDAVIDYGKESRSYAVGDTDYRADEATDNSKYYYNETKSAKLDVMAEIERLSALIEILDKKTEAAKFEVDFDTGALMYEAPIALKFYIDIATGELMYEQTT